MSHIEDKNIPKNITLGEFNYTFKEKKLIIIMLIDVEIINAVLKLTLMKII